MCFCGPTRRLGEQQPRGLGDAGLTVVTQQVVLTTDRSAGRHRQPLRSASPFTPTFLTSLCLSYTSVCVSLQSE